MYEQARNELLMKLSNTFTAAELDTIIKIVDDVMYGYEISKKETSVVIYNGAFPDMAKMYLASKKIEGLSDNSLFLYHNRLKLFFETIQKSPEEITISDIRYFLANFKCTREVTDRTLDKVRQILNGFFEWCVNEGYLNSNPARNIKQIKFEAKPRTALNRFELELVRRACRDSREKAIIDVLYSTGVRVNELVNMKFSDLDVTDKSIQVIGKGRKHNTVYLNVNAQISLEEYLNDRDSDSDYIFVSKTGNKGKMTTANIEKIFRELSDVLGLKVTPHTMRHTFATLALQSGMTLPQVQKCLAHSSVATTQIYAETAQTDVMYSHRKYIV